MCRCLDSTYPRMAPYVVLAELRNVFVAFARPTPRSGVGRLRSRQLNRVAGRGARPRPPRPGRAEPGEPRGDRWCSLFRLGVARLCQRTSFTDVVMVDTLTIYVRLPIVSCVSDVNSLNTT
jgi:hypothetical protein